MGGVCCYGAEESKGLTSFCGATGLSEVPSPKNPSKGHIGWGNTQTTTVLESPISRWRMRAWNM